MRKCSFLLAAAAAIAVFASCGKEAVASRSFATGCWPITDTLTGIIAVKKAGAQPITLDLVLEPNYGYQNLFVKVQAISPSGKKTELLYDLELIGPDGTWKLEQDGGYYHYRQPLVPALALTETGNHQMRVFHYMRDSALCHVRSAAMVFAPTP